MKKKLSIATCWASCDENNYCEVCNGKTICKKSYKSLQPDRLPVVSFVASASLHSATNQTTGNWC